MRVNGSAATLVIGAILLSINFSLASILLGTLGALAWVVGGIGNVWSAKWFGSTSWERLLFGACAFGGGSIIVLDVLYLIMGSFERWMVILVLWLCTAALFLSGRDAVVRIRIDWHQPWLFGAISVFSNVVLTTLLILARTDNLLVSPWNLFGPEVFIMLFVAIVSAILAAKERTDDLPFFIWMLVCFSAFSVSAIIYAIGFGFDPFLHRASQQAMIDTGVVEPVRLLYSGQYVTVSALHYLTALPMKSIDIWFLPVLTSIWLPIASIVGFERGWGLTRKDARMWWVGILAIPFMLATFTVPFTVTYSLFLGVMVAYPFFLKTNPASFFAVIIALFASALFHPLLSVPVLIFLAGERTRRILKGRWQLLCSGATLMFIGASVPFMLTLAARGQTGEWNLSGLTKNIQSFLRLFSNPYWDPYPYIPWFLDLLYEFRYWFPMILWIAAGVAVGCFKSLRKHARAHLIFSLGLLISIWGASTMFLFQGIIEHEQGEFALRLLQALYTFSLPVLVVVFAQAHLFELGRIILIALFVVIAWFFSYPQYNLKYPFFSPSVSATDIDTVKRIDKESKGEPYLVLSHQLMSAAAIQEFGFSHVYPFDDQEILWYAIPTGGPLYKLYMSTMVEGPSREAFASMALETGVRRIYFVAPSYTYQKLYSVTKISKGYQTCCLSMGGTR